MAGVSGVTVGLGLGGIEGGSVTKKGPVASWFAGRWLVVANVRFWAGKDSSFEVLR
jgi:hypothetical protein